ncbi:TolC family protein [Scleromatobacter humisilvae]|uniref:TolC family protein n=1 Tax=Scleromatobacter humisilvae TaxID=2897159 RepID=A0A9X1YJW0_9BURK|nr:TolC family protein [Scleromatobacter humisilvae]MCK9687251.1 TolC family protein [Scleromatobacter humisilvae]
MRIPALASLALAASLAACAIKPVGPDYSVPAAAVVNKPGAAAPFALAPASAASGATPFADAPLPPHWWRLYQDPKLDALIEKALARNTDLRVALANLEKAEASDRAVEGQKKPTISTEFGPAFGHQSGLDYLAPNYVPPSTWEYGAGASLSYQLDLFGRIQRAIEASHDDTQAAQAALDLVRINVAAGTARAYADACASGLRIASAEHSTELQQQALDISVRLQQAGRVGITDAARARSQLQVLKAALPPLQARRQAALYRLATLTGELPQDFDQDVASCAVPPHVAGTIPVGDGAALLRRRPDIRQAERQLAAATATIGVATADLYPRVSLGLSLGSQGLGNDFLGKDTFSYSVGPLISWTVPNTGVVRAHIAQANAGAEGALAKFDGTVLTALRETQTALDAYARELDRHAALQAARDESATVAGQARRLYQSGRTGYLDALDAERALASSEATLAQSDAELADDQVTLFMALGGGWEPEPARTAAAR